MADSRKTPGMSKRTDITAKTDTKMVVREGRFKILAPILVLLVICYCSLSAQGKYGGGSGEPNDPYLIFDANQMNAIGVDSNDWDKHFLLCADIDLSGYTGTSFNIIGTSWDDVFTGVFDGNGKKISNFTYASTGRNGIGLFGYVTGEIKDLGLIDPNVDAGTGYYVGSLVGYNYGTITNCYVEGGTIAGYGFEEYYGGVGGLVGRNGGTISNCYSTGSVSGGGDVGGLVGGNSGTITNCYSTGSASGGGDVGGLVGGNSGTITNSCSEGDVSGGDSVGGLVGVNGWCLDWDCYLGTISNCYSTGSVSGTTDVGGLVGLNGGYQCPSTGPGPPCFWRPGSISNCYSTGSVLGDEFVGGLVGYGGGVTDSFWDTQTSGQATSDGGTGKTTAQMQTARTFIAWVSCEPVWTIDEGKDYPRLVWENAPGEPITPQLCLGGGSGTQADPYLIYTAEQLNAIGLFPCLLDKHFLLCADIDLSGFTGTSFNIIGASWPNVFRGVFDGNGHTISNFTYSSTETDFIGLFGYVDGGDAEIKNLGLIDPNVEAGTENRVGLLVGRNGGTITNCYVEAGSISGTGWSTGGLVGYNCEGTITNCYSTGSVSGTSDVGGLVGYNWGTITNCCSTGSVTGVGNVGGLVGWNDGTITNCYSTGSVSGTSRVGGLVGRRFGAVISSFWDIETSGQPTSAGGTGKMTAEMQTMSTFTDAGWDFVGERINGSEDIWMICEGEDYPRLWRGEKYGGGSGTADDPYLIYTSCQMNAIGADSNDWDKHFLLCADIDLSGYTGTSFNIIGTSWDDAFTGVFDGNGHTISNFTYTSTGRDYKGLFGYVTGEIKDLGLIAPNVDAGIESLAVGSLVGELRTGTVIGCYSKAVSVSGSTAVGGLVGQNWSGTITNCYAIGDVSGNNFVGGLVGLNHETSITNCYSFGSVSSRSCVGGLVGINFSGIISNCYSSGSVSGDDYVGGLVGDNYLDGTITNCYSTGSVTGTMIVGGLVGHNGRTITNCYATGNVSGDEDVGGLVGKGSEWVTFSFWDIETSGQPTSDGGTGLTTAEMQDPNTFIAAGWDFVGEYENSPSDDWAEPAGGGYPIFWWQLSPLPELPTFSGGAGTPDDPYRISTANDLNRIGHNSRLMGAHFKLINDIDLSSIDFFIIGSRPFPFNGIFDGNGHTISNLTYDFNGVNYIGLFGYVEGENAEIKNLGLIDPNFDGGGYVGSLVGYLSRGTITDCYVEGGSVSGSSPVGGLVGWNWESPITNCYSTGSVSGNRYVGGLVGDNWHGTITNCNSTASVSGNRRVGGLVGDNGWGTVINCYSTGSVSGTTRAGGLVGHNFIGQITNCYSTGSASGNWGVGGLVGDNRGTISNCYSEGDVSGNWDVGGLVGYNGEDATITNCYSADSVSGDRYVGGLVGYDNGGSYTKCFWDNIVNPWLTGIGNTADPNVIGESTANMQTESTFTDAGWDFENIWWICEGIDYPGLVWEFPLPTFSGGSGEPNDPYLILTAAELNHIGHNPRLMPAHFKLINDIDLVGFTGTNFNIIGYYVDWHHPDNKPFTGVFDGDDHKISNFTWSSVGPDDIGLFEYVGRDGRIENLGLENVNIDAGNAGNVGGLVGFNEGTIINCYCTGSVSAAVFVGGLVGLNEGTITKCYSTTSVLASAHVGGLVGENSQGTITDSYSTGSVSGDWLVGGLVGYSYRGTITECYSSGSVSGKEFVGGLMGYNDYGAIINCYAKGGVLGNAYYVDVGGLVGKNVFGRITNCYSTGGVSGHYDVGGLVGVNLEGEITTSFWDIETSGQATSAGGAGLTTAEMQIMSTFIDAGWDFVGERINGSEDIWMMTCEGMSYPKLSWWQPVLGDYFCPDGVDMIDMEHLALHWLDTGCDETNDYCDWAEISNDSTIDFTDFAILADNWLAGL